MFGPNRHTEANCVVDRSHRDPSFLLEFNAARRLFARKFGLEDYDILFVPGPGTLAVEAVLASSRGRPRVIGAAGTFRERWRAAVRLPWRGYEDGPDRPSVVCRLETSRSHFNRDRADIVDAVSSFPYYPIGDSAIFVTSINKQLGLPPGFSVVGVHRRRGWPLLRPEMDGYSLLDLQRYRGPTPATTFPLHLVPPFARAVEDFDLDAERQRIDRNSRLVGQAVGARALIGERLCPVLTVAADAVGTALAHRWGLYESAYGRQIFTYACADAEYRRFAADCRLEKTRRPASSLVALQPVRTLAAGE